MADRRRCRHRFGAESTGILGERSATDRSIASAGHRR
jgi:hypothetical protein